MFKRFSFAIMTMLLTALLASSVAWGFYGDIAH